MEVNSSLVRSEPPVDQAIARLANAQHGVVSHAQLLALGLTENQIRYRIRVGRLHCVHRGVYAVGHRTLKREGHWRAAVFAGGDGAVLSHRSAGALWGIAPYTGSYLDVTAPTCKRSRDPLKFHRSRLAPPDTTVRDAIPVTTVPRTLLDLAEVVDELRLVRAFERAEKRELLDLEELMALIARSPGRHGLAAFQRALATYLPDDNTRSDFEREFLEFCHSHELPRPAFNALIDTGRATYEVDAFWPEARLVVELDSWTHHGTRPSFESDRVRDTELMRAGFWVARLTWRRIRNHPLEVAELLRDLIDDRAGLRAARS